MLQPTTKEDIQKLLEYVVLGDGAIKLSETVQDRADEALKKLEGLITEARIDELERLLIPSAIHGDILKYSGNDIRNRIKELKK